MRLDALVLLAAVFALFPTLGCNRKPAPAGPAAAAAAKVTVVKPEMRPVKRVVEQPGTVQAFEETALLANLSGYVDVLEDDPDKKDRPPYDRFIDIGSRVKQGQVLARLAVPELDEEFKQKEALVKQAAAEVVQAEKAQAAAAAGILSAEAMVIEAEAGVDRTQALVERSQKEVVRISKQVSGGMDTSQALDDVQLQFKAAEAARKEAVARVASRKAAVENAKAELGKAAADIDAAKARLEVAKTGVNRVDALRGYMKIKSPFDGVVTHRAVTRGDFVKAGDKAPLFSVARIDPVRVVVKVPEAEAGLVAVGQEIQLTLQGCGLGRSGEGHADIVVAGTGFADATDRDRRAKRQGPDPAWCLRVCSTDRRASSRVGGPVRRGRQVKR